MKRASQAATDARHQEKQNESASRSKKDRQPTLYRGSTPQREASPSKLIAYDFETTRIRKGTPRPLYVTAFSELLSFSYRSRIESIPHLYEILDSVFLIRDFQGARFVAWNANHFDSYFVAAALLQSDKYVIRPYLTRSKNLRGMRVFLRGEEKLDPKQQTWWEFLDGIAMTGMQGVSLKKFTGLFAPDHQKLSGVIDFETEEFDCDNRAHTDYAMRDSEALWYSMRQAEDIIIQYFNRTFAATIGNVCIKIFKAHLPEGKSIYDPGDAVTEIVKGSVMRGGYCHCVRKYEGPIWKFDLNQAYAAAMRDARLPSGACYWSKTIHPYAQTYIARVRATKADNAVPFYCKVPIGARTVATFAVREIPDSWITSIELQQLNNEGWAIQIFETYFWDDFFSMREFVDKLEHTRRTCEGGPKGPAGTMIKAVGNHSYGKTVETLDPLELVLARECPEGFAEYMPDEQDKVLSHLWYAEKEITPRDYHKPQIGAFITAHVRMLVRRAALVSPHSWLYADTDCVAFTEDVAHHLDIDDARYGAWKVETAGEIYRVITKKVYAEIDFDIKDEKASRHAKGLNVRRLGPEDFRKWLAGEVPEQKQTQRQNFLKVMQGSDMYVERLRKGTAV